MYYLLVGFFIAILYINIVASYHLLRAQYYDNMQKSVQLLIIWLLPVVGSVLVMFFIIEQPTAPSKGIEPPSRILQIIMLSFMLDSFNTSENASNGTTSDGGFVDGVDGGNGDGGDG